MLYLTISFEYFFKDRHGMPSRGCMQQHLRVANVLSKYLFQVYKGITLKTNDLLDLFSLITIDMYVQLLLH